MKTSVSLIVYFLVLFNCYSQSTIKNLVGYNVSSESIDNFLQSRMDSLNIPGMSFAVVNDGKIVFHRTLGYANLEKKLPVNNKTIFEGASLSKSVFAFFVMTFVDKGELDLDRPLHEYLPYEDIAYDDRYKKITARMVLSHRTGLPNWRENEEDKKLKIKFDPGTAYEYSGEGYQYLAMVLKQIEGTDWKGLEAIFQERVAYPLELDHTVFVPNEEIMKNKAQPYNNKKEWIDWKNNYWYNKDKGRFVAPSSIHSEAIDFSKWMIALMNEKILSDNSYHELFKNHSTISSSPTGVNVYYALGFLTANKDYRNTYFHSGNNAGFTCGFLLDTEKKWGFILFTNSENGEKLTDEVWNFFERDKGS